MIDIKKEIAGLLSGCIDGMEASEIEALIEIPTDPSLGDYAFPFFRLAKLLRKAPPLIAADIAS